MYVIVTDDEKKLLELLKENDVKILQLEDEQISLSGKSQPKSSTYENVSDFLLDLGIKPHIKGFKYLEFILENDIDYAEGITRALYPTVAKQFETTPSRVERAIRHAVEIAIYDADICELYLKIFGNFAEKPTNSQFIEGCKLYLRRHPID